MTRFLDDTRRAGGRAGGRADTGETRHTSEKSSPTAHHLLRFLTCCRCERFAQKDCV